MFDARLKRRSLCVPLFAAVLGTAACDPATSVTVLNNQPTQLSIVITGDGTVETPSAAVRLDLQVGESADLLATALDAIGQPVSSVTVSWSSTDTSVVTVDAGGSVQAVGAGSAEIVVQTGEIFATVPVFVTEVPGPPATP